MNQVTIEHLKPVLSRVKDKLAAASFRVECGRQRTILNVDTHDLTALFWAVQALESEIEESEKGTTK